MGIFKKRKGKRIKKLTPKMQMAFIYQWLEQDIPLLERDVCKAIVEGDFLRAASLKQELGLMRFIRDDLITGATNRYPDGSYDIPKRRSK